MLWRHLTPLLALAWLAGCGPNYAPDTLSTGAVRQAMESGIVAGVRNARVSMAGTVTGAAAVGIAGSRLTPSTISAFTSLGGGIAGSSMAHAAADSSVFEYIVRKVNGDLVCVTQTDKTPLVLGQNVLVIAGSQARVVPDDKVPQLTPAAATAGTPSKPPVGPAESADTRPAEPARADCEASGHPRAHGDPAGHTSNSVRYHTSRHARPRLLMGSNSARAISRGFPSSRCLLRTAATTISRNS